MINTLAAGGLMSVLRLAALSIIGVLAGWKRYDRDTYMEVDVSYLPPSEVM